MSAETDSLALLGTKGGPAIRPGSTMPTSNLLRLGGRDIVVDCGLGVTRGLVDHGMALESLSLIFVTHLHSDHYLGSTSRNPCAQTSSCASATRAGRTCAHSSRSTRSMPAGCWTRTDDRLREHWMRSRTLAHDAARVAREADARALALNHLIPSDDPDYGEAHWRDAADAFHRALHVGRDGLVIPF